MKTKKPTRLEAAIAAVDRTPDAFCIKIGATIRLLVRNSLAAWNELRPEQQNELADAIKVLAVELGGLALKTTLKGGGPDDIFQSVLDKLKDSKVIKDVARDVLCVIE